MSVAAYKIKLLSLKLKCIVHINNQHGEADILNGMNKIIHHPNLSSYLKITIVYVGYYRTYTIGVRTPFSVYLAKMPRLVKLPVPHNLAFLPI